MYILHKQQFYHVCLEISPVADLGMMYLYHSGNSVLTKSSNRRPEVRVSYECVCMCVCVRACVCVYAYVRVYACVCICLYVSVSVYESVSVYYMYACFNYGQ